MKYLGAVLLLLALSQCAAADDCRNPVVANRTFRIGAGQQQIELLPLPVPTPAEFKTCSDRAGATTCCVDATLLPIKHAMAQFEAQVSLVRKPQSHHCRSSF